jgi:hypothetical protein
VDAVAVHSVEKTDYIGASSNLATIISQPPDGCSPERPAVLFLNAGIVHRIGPSRLHVKLARRLAEDGLLCARFDHSGIGDSGARRGTMEFMEAAVTEVQDVMDTLTGRYGSQRFIVFGLCSGADVGFEAAVADDRIAGVVQLDPWFYPTPKARWIHYKRHYGPQLIKPTAWLRFMKNRVQEIGKGSKSADLEEWFSKPEYIRITPARKHVLNGLSKLVKRDAKMLSIFSGTKAFGIYAYERQFFDAFPEIALESNMSVHHFADTTHLFTDLEHQASLARVLQAWLVKNGFLPT